MYTALSPNRLAVLTETVFWPNGIGEQNQTTTRYQENDK